MLIRDDGARETTEALDGILIPFDSAYEEFAEVGLAYVELD